MLAYTFGPRTDATCRALLALLTPFNISIITSDDWGVTPERCRRISI
ncbi:unnamed protein product (plasmid) [Klebsiella pneumoniae]|nr:unnamed protein product [Klebsiella pneumoniae]